MAEARALQVDHLKTPEISKILEQAKVVYSAGFFITACAPAIEACADHCLQQKKTYALVRHTSFTTCPIHAAFAPHGAYI